MENSIDLTIGEELFTTDEEMYDGEVITFLPAGTTREEIYRNIGRCLLANNLYFNEAAVEKVCQFAAAVEEGEDTSRFTYDDREIEEYIDVELEE